MVICQIWFFIYKCHINCVLLNIKKSPAIRKVKNLNNPFIPRKNKYVIYIYFAQLKRKPLSILKYINPNLMITDLYGTSQLADVIDAIEYSQDVLV